MTLGELRTRLRWRLDDTVLDYLWSDAELTAYLNESVNEACIRARLLLDSTSSEVTPIVVTAGKAEYPIHKSVFDVDRVWDSTAKRKLDKSGYDSLDELYPGWMTHTGPLMKYVLDLNYYHVTGEDDQTHMLRLYPIPQQDTTLSLTVLRLPFEPMVSDGDIPDIPTHLHPELLHWACHLAYLKGDLDTYHPDKAQDYALQCEQAFGPKQDAFMTEFRRKTRGRRVIARWF